MMQTNRVITECFIFFPFPVQKLPFLAPFWCHFWGSFRSETPSVQGGKFTIEAQNKDLQFVNFISVVVSKTLYLFSPLPGEMIQFESIWLYNPFQMAWNHQLAMIFTDFLNPSHSHYQEAIFAEPIRSNVSVQVTTRRDRQSFPKWFGTPS